VVRSDPVSYHQQLLFVGWEGAARTVPVNEPHERQYINRKPTSHERSEA
jgi:hypothetical protein